MPSTQFLTVNLRALGFDAVCEWEFEELPSGLYRIVEIPFGALDPLDIDLQYGDVVELAPSSDGMHELRSIRERGGWRRFDFVLSRDYVGSQEMEQWLSRVEAAGGSWIREAGGAVTIVLPPDSNWDPQDLGESPI